MASNLLAMASNLIAMAQLPASKSEGSAQRRTPEGTKKIDGDSKAMYAVQVSSESLVRLGIGPL